METTSTSQTTSSPPLKEPKWISIERKDVDENGVLKPVYKERGFGVDAKILADLLHSEWEMATIESEIVPGGSTLILRKKGDDDAGNWTFGVAVTIAKIALELLRKVAATTKEEVEAVRGEEGEGEEARGEEEEEEEEAPRTKRRKPTDYWVHEEFYPIHTSEEMVAKVRRHVSLRHLTTEKREKIVTFISQNFTYATRMERGTERHYYKKIGGESKRFCSLATVMEITNEEL